MEGTVCQCCAMPLTDGMLGTNADGSINGDYCKYCYQDGKFQFEGTMEEMIELCVPYMVQADPAMTEGTAREIMSETLPNLKRWKR